MALLVVKYSWNVDVHSVIIAVWVLSRGHWQVLISTLATNIVGYISKAGVASLSTVMRLLVDMVTTAISDITGQTLASLCCSLVPENLTRSLLRHIENEMVMLPTLYCTPCPKNDAVRCYNFDIHQPILILAKNVGWKNKLTFDSLLFKQYYKNQVT